MRHPRVISLVPKRLEQLGGLGGLANSVPQFKNTFQYRERWKETPVTPGTGLSPFRSRHYDKNPTPS